MKKPFNGPKRQGGWIAGIAIAAAASYASSRSSASAAEKQNKTKYADERDLSNLDFQQRRWLQEQARVWQQQDKQFDLNYKENAIAGFRDAAPGNVLTEDGSYGAPPAPTQLSTSGLAPVQDNGQAAIIDPRSGKPVNGSAPPLSQFGGAYG